MRRILLLLLCAALPLTAAAQNENVTVIAPETLAGVWKISLPDQFAFDGSDWHIGVMRDTFCRMEQARAALVTRCLGLPGYRNGTGTIDGNDLHLAWGVVVARLVMDTTLKTNSAFDGKLGIKFFGVYNGSPARSLGQKILLPTTTPDTAGKTGLLKTILAQLATGALTVSRDDAAIKRNAGGESLYKPDDLRKLGEIEAVFYLGEGSHPRGKDIPPFNFSVYAVEFANGQRLCGIHQRDDGVIDGFLCV